MNVLGLLRERTLNKMNCVQYYRTYLPLREVDRHAEGINVAMISPEEAKSIAWEQVDIVVAARLYNLEAYRAAQGGWGGALVFDSDDDLTETHKLVSGRGPEFCEVLEIVDYVTVSTQPLADRLAPYTQRPPVVLKNCVDGTGMQHVASNARRITDGLTIGFTGSPTHWGDWRLPAVPFSRILRDYDVQGILHGEVPRYLGFAAPDLINIAGVPLPIYPITLSQFDIVLCAVDIRDEFNVGKSAIKALECMALGVVPICSPFGPYLELEAEGAPVVIVSEDSQDGWYEAMRVLVTDELYRTLLSGAGPGWVAENRDMVNTGWKQWASFYRSIHDDNVA